MSAAIFFARYWKQILFVIVFFAIAGTIAGLYIKTRNQEAKIVNLTAKIEGYEKTLKKVEVEIAGISASNKELSEIETERDTQLIKNREVIKKYRKVKQIQKQEQSCSNEDIYKGDIKETVGNSPDWIVWSRINELFGFTKAADGNTGQGKRLQDPGAAGARRDIRK